MTADPDNILVILYDLATVIGSETRLDPLLTRTLQRLLYHTSFPAGFVCLGRPDDADAETVAMRLQTVVGDHGLAASVGERVRLPAALVVGDAAMVEDAAPLAALPGATGHYRAYLRLPIDGEGVIVLLASAPPSTDLPLTRMFQTALAHLARAIVLCRHHEAHEAGIVAERASARQARAESEEKFRLIAASAEDAIVMLDAVGRIVYWNPAAARSFGCSSDDARGRRFADRFVPARERAAFDRRLSACVAPEATPPDGTLELVVQRDDGSEFPAELSLSPLRLRDRPHVVAIFRDVTARKRAEDDVRRLSEQNRQILDSAGEGIYGVDREGVCTLVNPAAAAMLGYAPEEIVGHHAHELFHHSRPDGSPYPEAECRIQHAHRNGRVCRGSDEVFWRKDGSCFPVEYLSTPIIDNGQIAGAVVSFLDITERKAAEERLRRSEDSLKEAQRIAHLGNWDLDLAHNVLEWSAEIFRIFEVDPAQFGASYEAFLERVHPDDRDRVNAAYADALARRAPIDVVHRLQMPDGREKYVHVHGESLYSESGEALRSIGTVQDITAERLADIALSKVNRALRTLSAGNEVLVRTVDEDVLLAEMCRVIVESGGYRMAWVGYAEDDAAKTIRPVAQFGAEGYVDTLHLSWNEADPHGRGPAGRAIRTRRPAVVADIASDPALAPWRDAALARGFASVIVLPLADDTQLLGALSIYAAEPVAFDDEEITLLQELATDLTYGILNLRARRARHESEAQLRETLVDTIGAIARTVEKRDPYTGGHQQRVAELADEIARELGLDAHRIEGLRFGAMIHDIGKLYVPAEILSRPGKLSAAEFEIIKCHPQVGYDIVKDVRFPWPVAQMILQHHEHFDGSGYPNGLKGEAILLEARILTVADVVEAIATHRPYRPARGHDSASDEIVENRGRLYDPVVVDACLRVLRGRGAAPTAVH